MCYVMVLSVRKQMNIVNTMRVALIVLVVTTHNYFSVFVTGFEQIYNLTVDYYTDVIVHGIRAAKNTVLPENAYEYKPIDKTVTEFGTFDYILVGAGSAGSVMATRLSEEQNLTILLIEAGGPENPFSDIPAMLPFLLQTKFTWNSRSLPQNTSCLGFKDRRCFYPRGKALGGSTVINGVVYSRANKYDYDKWEKDGNSGWSYNDVLPYFMKSENSQIDGDPGYHGKEGLFNIEYYRPYEPYLDTFIKANLELGSKVVDYNGKEQLGVARIQLTNLIGRRESTAKAFLARAINRHNLKVVTNSLVTKILINNLTKTAYGVQFSNAKQNFNARASKGVIVSSGFVGSPQLLMLSGIGPAVHLYKLRIPVIQDLPVGDNLRDHVIFVLSFSFNSTQPPKSLSETVEDFLHGSGILTGNCQGVAWVQSNLKNIPGVPDIEIIVLSESFDPHYIDNNNKSSKIGQDGFQFLITLLRSKSHGYIRLKSSSPYEYPEINSRLLSDPNNEDIERLYQGIEMALKLINTNAFKELNASLITNEIPECSKYAYLSRNYWFCQIRYLARVSHSIGTCKMGKRLSDGVVDHKLRVHGIKRLRVADASIIPSPISGHTSAPTVMIGEKLSDMLRKEFNGN